MARSPTIPSASRGALTAGLLVGVLLAVVLPMILRDSPFRPAGEADERAYHAPTIERFAAEWPHPQVSDYPSATTPGYHLVMAAVRRYVVPHDLRILRLFGAAFTVGLIATLGWAVGRRMNPWIAAAVCLPLVCSAYVLSSAVRLLPDNAAWWGVLAVLLVAFTGRTSGWTRIGGGLCLLALLLVRQIHLWAAAPLAASAWLGATDRMLPQDTPDLRRRFARMVRMLLTIMPSVLALTGFFVAWHGTLPPSARQLNAGGNPASPAFALALFGLVSPFFAGFLVPSLRGKRGARRAVLIGVLVGVAAALAVETDYNFDAGRWSGLWEASRRLPVVGHRSILMVALSALGGACVATIFLALPRRDGWIFLTTVLAFMAAQCATHFAFQRYFEPFWLILLPLVVARIYGDRPATPAPPRWAGAGPILLVVLTALTRRLAT